MSIRLSKPWLDLDDLDLESVPAQLGVFQLADDTHGVIYIGYAGGRQLFGLRSAIADKVRSLGSRAAFTRFELTHGYLSRWEELMMVHLHDTGAPPIGNVGEVIPTGHLEPGDAPATTGPSPDRAH